MAARAAAHAPSDDICRPHDLPHQYIALHLAAWLGMLVLAVLNGALREALLTPALGDTVGRQLSTLLLLAAGWFWFLRRRRPLTTAGQAWLVGAVWLAMTLALETFIGRALGGRPWVGGLRGLPRARRSDLDPRAVVDVRRTVCLLPRVRAKAAKQVKAVPRSRHMPFPS